VYGWTLRKTLQAWGYQIDMGSLYPLLSALEQDRLLHSSTTVTEGRKQKYYQITEQGRSCYTGLCRKAAPPRAKNEGPKVKEGLPFGPCRTAWLGRTWR